MLKVLSKSTGLPLEVVLRVLSRLGMSSLTPEVTKSLREERVRYMTSPEYRQSVGFLKKSRLPKWPRHQKTDP